MDSGTMVRAAGDEMGTVRVASTVTDGASTMIEHGDTLPSQLGTMVINAEDEEEEGTMKSKALVKYTPFLDVPYTFQRKWALLVHMGSARVTFWWCGSGGRGRGQLACGVRGKKTSATRRDFLSNLNGPFLIECCHFLLFP